MDDYTKASRSPRTTLSIGQRLRQARLHRGWSQERLAEIIEATAASVSRWERDLVLPHPYYQQRLCRALGLDLDTLFGNESVADAVVVPTPIWSVPFPRNPYFTGRAEVLHRLHTLLHAPPDAPVTRRQAISGLGGVGKTQTALEYAYRYALEYSTVFWIGAETVENIISCFLGIAALLKLPEARNADQQRIIEAVLQWLSTRSGWLLIWDNLEELELLQRFLPPLHQGTVLITTRHQALGTLAQGIELPAMTPEEGMLLVLRRAKVLSVEARQERLDQLAENRPADYAAARDLVMVLGGLPLALDQAGAYIEETGCSIADYLDRYEQQRALLLDRRGMQAGDHPHSVTATFVLASQRVKQDHPMATALLRVCTCLHAEDIPEELFVAGASLLGPELAPMVADPYQLDRVVATLRTLSLIQRHPETHTFSLHRLVQAVLREEMDQQEQAMWIKRVVNALNAVFPEVEHETWSQCERLVPHALVSAAETGSWKTPPLELASLLFKVARYFQERARYGQAELLYWRVLAIREQALGAEHSELIRPLNSLAIVCLMQSKYEEAESLFRRAIQVGTRTSGRAHLDLGNPLNNLANLYWEQGRYKEAEPLYWQALDIYKQKQGPEHPDVARALSNLAMLYGEQRQYDRAIPLAQQAVQICERVLGPEHPNTAYPLTNLADLYRGQDKDKEAEPLYLRAVSIWEQTLEPDHPILAYPLTNLASLYRDQGKYKEAEPFYQRALTIREQHLGPQHLETAQTLYDLAIFHQKQGDLREAVLLAERALKIYSQSSGDAHPRTVTTRALCAQLVQEQGYPENEAFPQ